MLLHNAAIRTSVKLNADSIRFITRLKERVFSLANKTRAYIAGKRIGSTQCARNCNVHKYRPPLANCHRATFHCRIAGNGRVQTNVSLWSPTMCFGGGLPATIPLPIAMVYSNRVAPVSVRDGLWLFFHVHNIFFFCCSPIALKQSELGQIKKERKKVHVHYL